jgi:hypothetical protein
MISIPLFGDSRPNVRMTERFPKPSLAFATSGSLKAISGIPSEITSIFSIWTP